jgi:hypothetical protein
MSDKKMENPAQMNPVEAPSVEAPSGEPSTQGTNMFQFARGRNVILLVLATVWILAGISAFVYSLYCFTKSGTTAEKILGLILAMIAGPFYFIYVAMYNAYCR